MKFVQSIHWNIKKYVGTLITIFVEMRQHKMGGVGGGVEEGQNVVTSEKGKIKKTWWG